MTRKQINSHKEATAKANKGKGKSKSKDATPPPPLADDNDQFIDQGDDNNDETTPDQPGDEE